MNLPDWSRMANTGNDEEPATAPEPNKWYEISLGPSFADHLNPNSSRFCTLRYDFKPASIDKTQPGWLTKSKDNRVTVEFQNNVHGRPKASFEGVSEDYKDNDAVLFFDGHSFRLERLYRAVKRLRHVREHGETTAVAPPLSPPPGFCSPHPSKGSELDSFTKEPDNYVPIEAGQVDITQTVDTEQKIGMSEDYLYSPPKTLAVSPGLKNGDPQEAINAVDDYHNTETMKTEYTPVRTHRTGLDIDINLPHQMDSDDEIANVDAIDDEGQNGCNAAEVLRAQVNAEGRGDETSSSSSSASDSSETASGSETSSHDSQNCDGDSVISI